MNDKSHYSFWLGHLSYMKYSRYLIACVTTVSVLLLPYIVWAQSIISNEVRSNSGTCYSDGTCTLDHVGVLIVSIATLIISLSGVLAFAAFVYGGFRWLLSAGSPDGVTKGKEAMKGAVIGLAIVFFSYTIVYFVAQTMGISNIDLFRWGGFRS